MHSDSVSKILWLGLSSLLPQGPSQLVLRCQLLAQFTGPKGRHLVLALILRIALGFPWATTSPSEAGSCKVSGAGEQRGRGQRSGLCGTLCWRLSFFRLRFFVSVIRIILGLLQVGIRLMEAKGLCKL